MKKTLQECKEIVARDLGYIEWEDLIIDSLDKIELTDLANKMYYEQSEWISVEDALPECGIKALTYGGWGLAVDSYEMTLLDGTIFFKGNKEYNNSEVTHWQPILSTPNKI